MNKSQGLKLLGLLLGLQLAVSLYSQSEPVYQIVHRQWKAENAACHCDRPLHTAVQYIGYLAIAKVCFDVCRYGWNSFTRWLCCGHSGDSARRRT